MSKFKLSKNSEELASNMNAHLDFVNASDTFYKVFPLHYKDCSFEESWVEFCHQTSEFEGNRYGSIHGGVLGIFLDTAMGLAAYEAGVGNSAPTMDMNINYLKAVRPGDVFVIRAQILNAGKRSCVVRGDLYVDGEKTRNIVLPETIGHISAKAFYRCYWLSSIQLPASLTIIHENSFYRCLGLKSITLPENINTIGDYAFSECEGLVRPGAGTFAYGYETGFGVVDSAVEVHGECG